MKRLPSPRSVVSRPGASGAVRRVAVGLLVGGVGACQRPAPSADGDASARAVAPVPIGSSASAPASLRSVAFAGAYTAERGVIDAVPVRDRLPAWDEDDGSRAVGSGTLAVDLDPSGIASGTAAGALGDQLVAGFLDGDTLRLRLTPATPAAAVPFAGVVLATRVGVGYEGELQVSSGDSRLIRRGKVTLAPAPAR